MTVAAQLKIKNAFNIVAENMKSISEQMNVIGDLMETGEVTLSSARSASKSKKAKVARDPDAPKQPMTSYFLFSKDIRPQLKERMPEAKSNELAVQMGAIWRGMSAEEKKPYVEQATLAQKAYMTELEAYKEGKKEHVAAPEDLHLSSSSDHENHSPVSDVIMSTPKSATKRPHDSHENKDSLKKDDASENPKKKKKKSKKDKSNLDSAASS
eukprot:NODE_543_length_6878_cov_0.317008.p4 type:complete len:212 gc:universal NODE_543_length_6878_cov_0.317008:201-836(+)